MIKMLHNRCMGIYKFGNNTYPWRIRRRLNFGQFFGKKSAFYGPGNTVIGVCAGPESFWMFIRRENILPY
jgi:hypothetical protein